MWPDILKEETADEIMQRMLSRVPDDIDKSEGSYIWDSLYPSAFELYQQKEISRYLIMQAFARYASGSFLLEHANDRGVKVPEPKPSIVYLLFNVAPGTIIPKGTRAGVENTDISFGTDEEVVIDDESSIVSATCEVAGTVGNVLANKITMLLDSVPGVISVTNPMPATGGIDVEPDDTLRYRILQSKQNPEKGGGDSDYERWALSVANVQWARAINKARGLGTVDVVISGPAGMLDQLVVDVQAQVDSKKPSGVDAKVRKVNIVTANFNLQVFGISKELAQTIALDYLNSIGVGGTAVLSKLVSVLIISGASDVNVIEPINNVVLPNDSILVPVVTIL